MKTEEHIKRSLEQFEVSSRTTNLFDPNIQETATKYFQLTDEIGNKFRLFAFTERVLIETTIKTSLLFTVNLPDIVCFANKPLGVLKNGHDIYTNGSDDREILKCVALVEADLQDLRLERNEGVFVYRNGLQLVLDGNRNLVRELSILRRIKSVIEANFPEGDPDIINTSRIPLELHGLIPFLSEWAIADDLERDEKIERSSINELKTVLDTVSPKMELINQYLSNFDSEPLTYEATLLGNLAELVSELMLSKW